MLLEMLCTKWWPFCSGFRITHGNTDQCQHWLTSKVMACSWQHQAFNWSNIDFSLVMCCAFTWQQFYCECPNYYCILYNDFKSYTFEITATSPRDQWIKDDTGQQMHTILHSFPSTKKVTDKIADNVYSNKKTKFKNPETKASPNTNIKL